MNPPFGVDPQKASCHRFVLVTVPSPMDWKATIESVRQRSARTLPGIVTKNISVKLKTGLRPVGFSYGKLLQALPSPCRSKSCGSPGPAASKKAWASFWVRKSEQSRSGPLGSNLRFDVDETVLDDGFVVF